MVTHRSDAEPAIRVDGLRVVRGGRTVLPGLTLAVPRGQLIGLLGPSGCGKTTLMRCIVGVQQVAGGTVEVLGKPAGSDRLRRRVGYLTQDASVYLDLTITENLRYFATVVGVPRHGVDAEVLRVLGLVDLVDHALSRAGNLSGGELSRVSLAAALVGKPEVLVLDEAIRCDRRLLMRAGTVLADDTLQGVLTSTGTTDAEQAFLALVDRANSAALDGSAPDTPPAHRPSHEASA